MKNEKREQSSSRKQRSESRISQRGNRAEHFRGTNDKSRYFDLKEKAFGKKKADKNISIIGKMSVTRNGYGFVKPQDVDFEMRDIFIPIQYMKTSLTGDEVLVNITDLHNEKGPVGEVERIANRKKVEFVGEVIDIDNRASTAIVKPLSNAFRGSISMRLIAGVDVGDWIEFSIAKTNDYADVFQTEIIRKLDTQNRISGILDGITAEYDLPLPYSDEEENMAKNLLERKIVRRDFTSFLTLTIDPIDAKDFDDALSVVSITETVMEIAIHIADVAAYVAPHEYFDKCASERCFTNYLPGRMIPMLPKSLLAEKCSLNAGEEKLAHTVLVKINLTTGEILSSERFHSTVNVAKRMSYEEVQNFLNANDLSFHEEDGEESSDLIAKEEFEKDWQKWDTKIQECIKQLFAAYKIVRKNRQIIEGYLEVSPKEIRILCAGNPPKVEGIRIEKADEAHEIVEEFMLLANSLVAKEMDEKKIPTVYRTHPEPKPESLKEFSEWLWETVNVKSRNLNNRKNINSLLKNLKHDDPYFEVIMISFVRSMERALYEATPALHYGLGKMHYLHFTSPIRRYSDLFAHQQLWEFDTKGKNLRTQENSVAIAAKISAIEVRYDEAYWSTNDRLKLYFIQEKLAKGDYIELSAVIMNFLKREMAIYVPELALFNTIKYEEIDTCLEPSENGQFLCRRDKKLFKKGEIIKVKISGVTPNENLISFSIATKELDEVEK